MRLRHPIMTTFRVNEQDVAKVVFFDKGKVVLDCNAAYIPQAYSAHLQAKQIESCLAVKSVANARKVDLDRCGHFLVNEGLTYAARPGKTLYLYLGAFMNYGDVTESVIHMEGQDVYQRGFDVTDIWNDEAEPRTVRISPQSFSKTVFTGQRAVAEELATLLNKEMPGTNLSGSQVMSLFPVADQIVAILSKMST
jgi:hypothetical protein